MEKKRAIVFVGTVYALAIICTLPLFFYSRALDQQMFQFLIMITGVVFMWLPVLAVFLTRKITRDPFKVALRPRFKRYWRSYLGACFLPGAAVCVGTAAFFLLFPDKLDLTWGYVQATIGMTPPFTLSIPIVLGLGVLATLVAPLVIVNHILAFGEEFGWRGYLLYKLRSCMSDRTAVLLSGALWGLAHAPLVSFGLNYNMGYPGFPLSGILMMVVFATVIGIWFSDLTIRTNSVIAASVAHGALNAVREAPLFISVMGVNTLLGPKPSGIIGMAGLILLAVIILIRWETAARNRRPA